MPTLTLYTDLSPNRLANICAAAKSPSCAPLKPHQPWNLPSHQFTWRLAQDAMEHPKKTFGPLHSWINQLVPIAEKRHDLLLVGYNADAESHGWLLKLLRSLPEIKGYDFQAVIALGRQDILLEQRFRVFENHAQYPEKISQSIHEFSHLDRLLRLLIQELGRECVTVLYDDWPSPVPRTEVVPAVREALGLHATVPPPPRIVSLASRQARHIWRLHADMRNAWLECSPQVLFDTLAQCERENPWDKSLQCPPALQEQLEKQSSASNAWIAKEFSVPLSPVGSQPWNHEAGHHNDKIDDQALDAFIAALPKRAAKNLARRCAASSRLLTPEQQRLAARLESHFSPHVWVGSPAAKVFVLTLAYNQERYISECIESVLAQKTSFPIKHIIVDHGSTDDTPQIISEYAEKYQSIVPILLPQRFRGGENVRTLFSVADTDYAALCDGDDYFTEPCKLQKQVDFLEAHPDYGLCFHPVHVIYEDGTDRERFYPPLDQMPRGVREFYYLADLIKQNLIQTNSVMYRWRFKDGLPDWFRSDLVPGDWYWHLLHAEKGKIGFINEVMSVYRRHRKSLYYTSESFDTLIEHRLIHGMKELETYEVVNKHFDGRYLRAFSSLANGVFSAFLKHQLDTGDESYLKEATERFPILGGEFLKELKIFRVSRGKQGE